MAVVIGQLPTRILMAVGDTEPVEIGTITTELVGTRAGEVVKIGTRSWRRSLAIGFLRMAWATATGRSYRA